MLTGQSIERLHRHSVLESCNRGTRTHLGQRHCKGSKLKLLCVDIIQVTTEGSDGQAHLEGHVEREWTNLTFQDLRQRLQEFAQERWVNRLVMALMAQSWHSSLSHST